MLLILQLLYPGGDAPGSDVKFFYLTNTPNSLILPFLQTNIIHKHLRLCCVHGFLLPQCYMEQEDQTLSTEFP